MLAKRPDTRLASNFSVFLINSVEAPITVIQLKWNQNRIEHSMILKAQIFKTYMPRTALGVKGGWGGGGGRAYSALFSCLILLIKLII